MRQADYATGGNELRPVCGGESCSHSAAGGRPNPDVRRLAIAAANRSLGGLLSAMITARQMALAG
jgi:hypothetical protein